MKPARRHATYEDVLAAPEHVVAEIIDGDLYTSPRPGSPHAFAASVVGADLLGPFHRKPGDPDGPGGWWILFEPELHVGPDVLVPDLAGWRHATMPAVPNVAYFQQVPDWICEVISPATSRLDRVRKMRIYARERVAHAWLVDPLQRTLEIYRLSGEHWILAGTHADAETASPEPFAAVELRLERWWIDT